MTVNIIKWVEISSVNYYALATKEPYYLYFLTDTKELYKGDTSYSGNVVFVTELPTANISINKLYILPNGYGYRYNNTTWEKIIYGLENVLDDTVNNQYGSASGEAIKHYISEKIKQTTLSDTKTPEELLVLGQEIGSYKDGDKIPKDTNLLEIMKKMLAKRIAATYSLPSLNFNISNTTVETGTRVSVNIIPTFIQNDAGNCTKYTLNKIYNGTTFKVVDQIQPVAYTEAGIQVLDGDNLKFTGGLNYADGPIKKDNLGSDSLENKIMSGIMYNTITYKGARAYFFGTKTEPVTLTNSVIRALSSSLSPSAGVKRSLSISAGTKQIIFAYPATLKDIESVVSSGLNLDVKEAFTLTRISVDGNENFTPIEYKVYSYNPAIPFPNSDTYTFTI